MLPDGERRSPTGALLTESRNHSVHCCCGVSASVPSAIAYRSPPAERESPRDGERAKVIGSQRPGEAKPTRWKWARSSVERNLPLAKEQHIYLRELEERPLSVRRKIRTRRCVRPPRPG